MFIYQSNKNLGAANAVNIESEIGVNLIAPNNIYLLPNKNHISVFEPTGSYWYAI